MRFQTNEASCGLAAMSNALGCLGIKRTEDELAPAARFTAANGTNPRGMIRALSSIPDLVPEVIHESRADVAVLKLQSRLRAGFPVILLVDNDDHWVVAFGVLGETVHVCDSAHADLVITYDLPDIMSRWKSEGRKPYYGIALGFNAQYLN